MAPLLILLVLGMLEYGRSVMIQQILTNASREGVRFAIADGASTSSVEQAVRDYMSNATVSGEIVSVNPDPSTAAPGDAITVTVQMPFANVSWLPSPAYLGGKTMGASATMRREGLIASGSPPSGSDEDEEEE